MIKMNLKVIILDKISKGLDYANSMKIPYVIFIGKEEVKKKKFKLRNMETGKEEMLRKEDIVKKVANKQFTIKTKLYVYS